MGGTKPSYEFKRQIIATDQKNRVQDEHIAAEEKGELVASEQDSKTLRPAKRGRGDTRSEREGPEPDPAA